MPVFLLAYYLIEACFNALYLLSLIADPKVLCDLFRFYWLKILFRQFVVHSMFIDLLSCSIALTLIVLNPSASPPIADDIHLPPADFLLT
jgi:hypothetical protein